MRGAFLADLSGFPQASNSQSCRGKWMFSPACWSWLPGQKVEWDLGKHRHALMVDSQQTNHHQESKGTVHMHIYLASCFKLWSTAMWLHRTFWRELQKWLRKVRLLLVGLNSLCGDSSSTGVFFYGCSNWQSLKNIFLGEKLLWRASFYFCSVTACPINVCMTVP